MKKGTIILIAIIIIAVIVAIYLRTRPDVPITGSGIKVPPPIDRPIRVGIVTWGGYAGGIMENNGFKANKTCDFYRDHGIQVDFQVIDDFVMSRGAFKAGGDKGGIDIMWGTVDSYALEYPALKALNPKCILQYDWSRGGDAIAVDGNKIVTAKDLKGMTISVAEETPSHYFALFVLKEAGLGLNDVKWRFVNSAIDAANAFKAGQVDATVSWSPDVYIAARERKGGKILMSTKEATNLIADIFIARGDFLEKYPEAAKAFITGYLQGVDKVHENPETVIKLMATGFNLPLEDSKAMLGDVHLPNAADNAAFFNSFDPVGYDAIYTKASKLWQELGKLQQSSLSKETRETKYLFAVENKFSTKRADPILTGPVEGTGPKTDIITKEVSITFATGSSTLDELAKAVIRTQVAPFVQTYGGCFVNLEGNTDNTGSYQLNKSLSRDRANSIKILLISEYNLPVSRFSVIGNASDKPVADNGTPEGRAKNRRTDIVIKSSGQ